MSMKYMFRVASILLINLEDGMTMRQLQKKSKISMDQISRKKDLFINLGLIEMRGDYNMKFILTEKGEFVKNELKNSWRVL